MSAGPTGTAAGMGLAQAVPAQPQVQVLHPGDVVLAERGDRLQTLLGSCIAVVLTDPRRTVGTMCHIVYSKPPASGVTASAAYADVALDSMYALLRARSIEPRLCEAFVYGGGNMFPALFDRGHVGKDNAQWVLAALAQDGVSVLHQDLGGNTYRRLSWVVGPDLPQVTAVAV